MMTIKQVASLVAGIDPNTRTLYWVGDKPGAYNVIVPHNASSLRTDDDVEDKLTLCSIHRFTKSPKDTIHEQIFDALVNAGVHVDDPVSDYSEIEELNTGGWIHHIIDCRVKR